MSIVHELTKQKTKESGKGQRLTSVFDFLMFGGFGVVVGTWLR